MANIKSFPNNQDVYIGAQEVMRWLHGRTSGVFGAEGNAVVEPVLDAMAVTVTDGNGWLSNENGDGIAWWIDNEETSGNKLILSVDMADAALPRIDRVVVSWQTTNYVALPEVKILKGVPASAPDYPALTNNNTVRQISLASIHIPAGATSITNLMIYDERFDYDVCGIVTETVQADTSMLYAQYREAIELIKSAVAQGWDGVIPDGSITKEKLAFTVSDEYGVFIKANMWKTVPEAAAIYREVDFDYDGDNSVYATVVTVPRIKSSDSPIIDVELSSATTASEAIAIRDAWMCVDRVVALDGRLVLYAFETKPDRNLLLKVKVVH